MLVEIHTEFQITRQQIESFEKNGFIHLKNVFSAEVIAYFEAAITARVRQMMKPGTPGKPQTTYEKAFTQVMNLWLRDDQVKEFVFSRRLASIATQLLQVNGVRLYHDQALYKERSGGYTPWHADQFYWPLASDRTVTAWIPLQETPLEMGPLSFSAKSHRFLDGRNLPISDQSEAELQRLLENEQFPYVEEPYGLGDVSFHMGWTYHRAGPNTTDHVRKVMTMIYMDQDMRLKQPENPFQQADMEAWCPGANPGERIRTPLNPALYSLA